MTYLISINLKGQFKRDQHGAQHPEQRKDSHEHPGAPDQFREAFRAHHSILLEPAASVGVVFADESEARVEAGKLDFTFVAGNLWAHAALHDLFLDRLVLCSFLFTLIAVLAWCLLTNLVLPLRVGVWLVEGGVVGETLPVLPRDRLQFAIH